MLKEIVFFQKATAIKIVVSTTIGLSQNIP